MAAKTNKNQGRVIIPRYNGFFSEEMEKRNELDINMKEKRDLHVYDLSELTPRNLNLSFQNQEK